jgi:hypothetical protein
MVKLPGRVLYGMPRCGAPEAARPAGNVRRPHAAGTGGKPPRIGGKKPWKNDRFPEIFLTNPLKSLVNGEENLFFIYYEE